MNLPLYRIDPKYAIRTAEAKPPRLQQVIVRMDPALHEALKAKAAADERSMAQAIRYAIRCYLDGPS